MRKLICLTLPVLMLAGCALNGTPDGLVPDPPAADENRFAGLSFERPQDRPAAFDDPMLDVLRSPSLARFRSEEEFLDWLRLTREAAQMRGVRWQRLTSYAEADMPVASAPPAPPPSAPGAPPSAPAPVESMRASPSEPVPVTGQAADSTNPEITNNQFAGVDEGGIVKQIGQHLVVLTDGRLFVTDLMPGGEPGLKLTDRADVYRSADEDTWYDEMLVAGRTILVTGYSYRENASEFTVLTLGEDGTVTRDATFYISSDDYYSTSNYATRMIDGKLVIHTPVYLSGRGWWSKFDPPVIREWRREEEDGWRERTEMETGRPLFRAEDIWMPVQRVLEPVVHMVTVCDISGATDSAAPPCSATAMVGSRDHEFLVTRDAFWLWLSPSMNERGAGTRETTATCRDDQRAQMPELAPSVLARLPIDGSKPSVLGVRGQPQNQFSMDMDDGHFRAVLDWYASACPPWARPEEAQLVYFDTPLSELGETHMDTAGGRYIDLPTPGVSDYEARFAGTHLVYGAREGWGSWPPPEGHTRANGRAIIVPLADPVSPVTLELPHDVIRAERAGASYVALTGYHDSKGLSVSLIDLRSDPHVSGSLVLEGRFESENRSHAFSSNIDADGEGLIGLPTIPLSAEASRWWWWSSTSDLSYVAVASDGTLAPAGMLEANRENPDEIEARGYSCEVSCIDWYGNARPIFTGGRILALVTSELVEGVLRDGQIEEVRRIDLTLPPEKPEMPES